MYTQLQKSFTVRNYPTGDGDLVKRFSSAWQGSFRFWGQHSQLPTADGGPELNHEDRRYESLAGENRAAEACGGGTSGRRSFLAGKVGTRQIEPLTRPERQQGLAFND
jgi:hypothetical protein